jgi:hypothetical protein
MRQGDVSRRRRLTGNGHRWYSLHRQTRFSLRMLAAPRNVQETAALTIHRIKLIRL